MSDTGSYPNRSDLRDAATRQVRFTGQTYGEGVAQERAQQMVPPGAPPTAVQGQQMASAQGQQMVRRPQPGDRPLMRPTERPSEPITAGAPFGPGPNRLSTTRRRLVPRDDVEENLSLLYEMYPNDGVGLLLQRIRETKR